MTTGAFANAIRIAGNLSSLARMLGKRQSTVWYWKEKGIVPAENCAAIEQLTGGLVTRYDLRPDVFGASPTANTINVDPVP